jgi:cytoskeletal protein CcmA (bactofilin family)
MRSILLALIFTTVLTPAAAQHDASAVLGGDQFVAGRSVRLGEPVAGDLFAAGGSVDVDAEVGGDALLAGGKVRIGGDVGHSLIGAGGQVTVHAKVGRNVRVAGGQVEFAAASRVAGNVSVAGGEVTLRGAVLGDVQAAGGRVYIDGPVGGNALAGSGRLELGPNARIAGTLRYRSGDALRLDPAAQVQGGIQPLTLGGGSDDDDDDDRYDRHERFARGVGWLWTIGLVLLAAVWLAVLPRASARVSQTLRERPGASLLLGFALLLCVPVAALLSILTLVGIPLGLLLLALYLALLPIGYVGAAVGAGDWALQRWRAAAAARPGWRIGAAALALVVLALLGMIPWLGVIVVAAALLAGLGALPLALRSRDASAA